MSALVQGSPIAPTVNSPSFVKALEASQLPKNALLPVYLIGRTVTLEYPKTHESRKACCVSFLQNLVTETNLTLADLIEGKRIGVFHIENHKVRSLTLTVEMLEILTKANIKGISIIQGTQVLSVEDNAIIRTFVSEEEYKKYTAKLI